MNPILLTAITIVSIIVIIRIYYAKGRSRGHSEGWDAAAVEIREFLGDDNERS